MLLSILTSTVLAFAPSTTTWIGVEPNRLVKFDSVTQNRLRTQQYWTHFASNYPTWKGRFDESNGKPYRMWGSGIPFDTTSESAVLSELVPFLESHELTGLKGSQLMVSAFGKDSEADRVYVQLRQVETLNVPVWNDVSRKMHTTAPVWRRGVEARFHQSKLTMLGVDVHSISDEGIEEPSVRVEASEALLAANPNGIPRFFSLGSTSGFSLVTSSRHCG